MTNYHPSAAETDEIRNYRQTRSHAGQAPAAAPIQTLLDNTRNQLGYAAFHNDDGSVRHVVEKPAASVSRLNIRNIGMPSLSSTTYLPTGTAAGKRSKLPEAVVANSRCIQAGAHLLMVPEAAVPAGTRLDGRAGPAPLMYHRPNMGFTNIEAASFNVVPDGADITAGTLPVYRALVDLETMPSLGFSVELTRADMKAYRDGELSDCAMASIALGVSRAIDAQVTAAIAAATPAEFSIAAAAAQGYEFGELRGLIGTAGAGAHIGQDGTLRAAGVLAELTPTTADTLICAWNRIAVGIAEDITLTASRVGVDGAMSLTCWINLEVLIPNTAACFQVSAS